ncbi:MAG: carotenoid biosynthesis protein [Planctomycetes bacterium]|nr:carotenoid biosynthesis protein [Planctomycetota bacterium]
MTALLVASVIKRPYVFACVVAALAAAYRHFGWKRALTFTVVTYATAFAAEYSSTRWAIPFGLYHYTGATQGEELYVANVPLFDSLSFVFLAYGSYAMALLFCLRRTCTDGRLGFEDDPQVRQSNGVLLIAAMLMTCLNVVLGPLAVRGDEWFLGRLFVYDQAGYFYGVPVATFLGWFFVGIVMLGLFQRFDGLFLEFERPAPEPAPSLTAAKLLPGAALWWGVVLFSLVLAVRTLDLRRPETVCFVITAVFLHVPILFFFLARMLGRTRGPGAVASPECLRLPVPAPASVATDRPVVPVPEP